MGLAESGAELPAVSQRSGAPSVFGSLFIAPALAHAPAKPRTSLLCWALARHMTLSYTSSPLSHCTGYLDRAYMC